MGRHEDKGELKYPMQCDTEICQLSGFFELILLYVLVSSWLILKMFQDQSVMQDNKNSPVYSY